MMQMMACVSRDVYDDGWSKDDDAVSRRKRVP